MAEPTNNELRAAFKRSGLWRRGWTYARAIDETAVRISLRCAAIAAQRSNARRGEHTPTQLGLIQ